MFIDAFKEIAQLDVLFYTRPDLDISPSTISMLERSFSKHWDTQIRLSLCPRFQCREHRSKWELYGAPALNFFKQPGYVSTSGPQQIRAFETCLRREPDAIFAHRLTSMCPALLTRKALPPIFLDLDDIEHCTYLRRFKWRWAWRKKVVYCLQLPALLWGEHRAIRLAQRTFVCSEQDRKYLTGRLHLSGVVTTPNAITTPTPKLVPVTPAPTLLFLGSYRYQPNVDAANFLIEQIWPYVYRAVPEARLIIAGISPEGICGYGLGIPGVQFTGFVDDLEELYRSSRVVCAPILSGGGTRIKIIEAAAYGKAIVATRVGAEGLDMHDGQELLLRDNPKSFSEACLELLKDSGYCKRLGDAAHSTVVRRYARDRVIKSIQSHVKKDGYYGPSQRRNQTLVPSKPIGRTNQGKSEGDLA